MEMEGWLKWGRPGNVHLYTSECKLFVGERSWHSDMYTLTLKASFLPVKASCFDYVNVCCPDQQWSAANE